MRPSAALAQTAWAAMSLPAWHRFRAALRQPARAQADILRRYLDANQHTAFGRAHGFASIRSAEEYRARVPIRCHDELAPWVRRIAAGEPAVLTAEPVGRLVPSSGSTSAVKHVPYTPALQAELSAAVGAWIADLYRSRPALLGGRAYWSVTPAVADSRSFADTSGRNQTPDDAAVPVGFDDDAAYLGGAGAWLARRALAVPSAVRFATTLETFQDHTLIHLLLAGDLRLVSIWHPSMFAGLLEALTSRWDAILDQLARCDPRRAREVARAGPDSPARIWPHLGLISCWADGPATPHADSLARMLPGVEVQAKGLLATEGFVSLPWAGRHPLAVSSHFLEFIGSDGSMRLAHELEAGAEYTVVITTGGGFYRYRLGDRVRVADFVGPTPSVRFVGRDDRVSDRFGEKLSDGFVAGVISRLIGGVRPAFVMLAPDVSPDDGREGYVLYVEADGLPPDLAAALERELRRNPHYAWCVDLGQLRPARVEPVGPGAGQAYLARCRRLGQRLGDIKPASLDTRSGWGEALPVVMHGRRI